MADFSIILQSAQVRDLVQTNLLERSFKDALFPNLMYRGEAAPQQWPGNLGDTIIMSRAGLMKPKLRALQPGVDPTPSTYAVEQWDASIQQWADTVDNHMPTSAVAAVDLFLRNAHQLGLAGGMTLNRLARNQLFAAALSGWTTASAQSTAGQFVLHVNRLNGFTKARTPGLAGAAQVRFSPVSSANPLPIVAILDNGALHVTTVTGFTPTTLGDETGPGNLTIADAIPGGRTVNARAAVYADDRTSIVRVGGGNSVDSLTASVDILDMAAIRSAVARFRTQNVPAHADGLYHCHLDPTGEAHLFASHEFQRLNTSLPDYVIYKTFAIGQLLGCAFFRNSESPLPETVDSGTTGVFSQDDPFAGELYVGGVNTGAKVHRALLTGQGGLFEYYLDKQKLLTEVGVNGKVGDFRITNNGIQVIMDRIGLVIRAPLDRLQQMVSTSYQFIGSWVAPTDASNGDAARYKRIQAIEFTE